MKINIYWSNISGYMAACWRALAQHPDVDLLVVARRSGGKSTHTSFNEDLMRGIPCELLPSEGDFDDGTVKRTLEERRPDIVIINGWHTPAFVKIPFLPGSEKARFIMAMDTPYLGTVRQRYGKFAFKAYFNRIDRVFVTGERCWQLARVLGFPERTIRRGVYGVDLRMLSPLHERRFMRPEGWPRRFLFTGRYVKEKAIDVMMEGYSRYRRMVPDPWPMTCCGQGPFGDLIRSTEGVTDRGFVQPYDLPDVLVEHGVFVLASRFDPWPLVIVEACAAGLPIVCSEACGTRVELVRFCYNGCTFATDDPASLAESLAWIHGLADDLPTMGARSRYLAEPYSAEMWVKRWMTVFRELSGTGRGAMG